MEENNSCFLVNHFSIMSRTKRSKKRFCNRMSPYIGSKHKGSPKFEASLGEGIGVSPLSKLVARNANRSRKKSARQEARVLIRLEMDTDHYDS